MSYERRALVVCCRIHSLILWQLSVNWIWMGHYLVALTLSNNTMFTSSFMITDQLFFFGFTWRGNHMIRPKRRVGCANSYFPPEKIAYPKSRNWLLILVWFTCSWWEYRISKKRQRVMISFYSNSLYCYMYLITDRVCMTMTPPPPLFQSLGTQGHAHVYTLISFPKVDFKKPGL